MREGSGPLPPLFKKRVVTTHVLAYALFGFGAEVFGGGVGDIVELRSEGFFEQLLYLLDAGCVLVKVLEEDKHLGHIFFLIFGYGESELIFGMTAYIAVEHKDNEVGNVGDKDIVGIALSFVQYLLNH